MAHCVTVYQLMPDSYQTPIPIVFLIELPEHCVPRTHLHYRGPEVYRLQTDRAFPHPPEPAGTRPRRGALPPPFLLPEARRPREGAAGLCGQEERLLLVAEERARGTDEIGRRGHGGELSTSVLKGGGD